MSTESIQKLFANDISRRIEEVIKVDQADEAIIKEELTEYVVTDSIRDYFNIERFNSLQEAKLLAEQHRIEYNVYRPHSALQGRTPLEVLQQWKAA